MRQFNFLSKLLGVEPSEAPFLSIYLNTEPNGTGKKDFDVFLKKQLNDHLAVLDVGSAARDSLTKDSDKIRDFAESLDSSIRGAAIFASSGNNDFFQTFEFETPFDRNEFYLFDRPFMFPLLRLMDRNPMFVVVAADTNAAHILVSKTARTVSRDDIQNTKTNRTEVGGWSQMRYQRHVENFHQQHAKEIVEELEKIVRTDRIERVVLVGDQAVIIPLLREQMSEEMRKKIVGSLPMNVDTPEHELSEAARQAVAEFDAAADKENIEYLFDVNYDEGTGVTGFDKTLSALFNGQVQDLYLNADLDDIAYRVDDIKVVLKDYAPGIDENLPSAGEKEFLVDELIRQAATSADRIRFIGDPHLLKTVGGVGALLRYQTKGASSK